MGPAHMTTETITVRTEGLTLDQLVWRRFRRPVPGLVEQVLDLNPGLAQLGPYLPLGAEIILPTLEQAADPVAQEVIQLWD
jgi:phage tail protein X